MLGNSEGTEGYEETESFPMERPPSTDGLYGVLFEDDTAGVSVWSQGRWEAEKLVKRYSGTSVRVGLERRRELLSRIVGGLNVPETAVQRLIARAAALALARHEARKYGRAKTEAQEKAALLNMCGLYKVAQGLGVSFDRARFDRERQVYEDHEATPTDVAHLEKYWVELEPFARERIIDQLKGPANEWNPSEWAVETLQKTLANAA
jgi:hypothetical protein